jgi:phosphoribosylformylglycinamidine synthase
MAHIMGAEARFIWHKQTSLPGIDFLIIPGGFSYGDYLRSGAIARFSPVMQAITQFAEEGRPILGICNGFQILLEAGLLPGTMLYNKNMRFVCKQAYLRCETTDTLFTRNMEEQQILKLPVAHGEGNYFTDAEQLKELRNKDQIIFRYCGLKGSVTEEANFNGSIDNIAGICNEQRNVLGMMPHPERAVEKPLGSDDGKILFESILNEFGTLNS